MHQCAIAIFASYSSACRHERSDSVNQNEWICEMPCRKNARASADEVVTGKSLVMPMPGSSFAGSSGCAPGGTAHRSGSFCGCACVFFAITPEVVPATTARSSAAKDSCFIAHQYSCPHEARRKNRNRQPVHCLVSYGTHCLVS